MINYFVSPSIHLLFYHRAILSGERLTVFQPEHTIASSDAVSARVTAIGLVDAYIASNPTKSGMEVSKWCKQKKNDDMQHKKSFDYKLRMLIPQLEELGTTNPTFDVSEDHSLSQIIREIHTNYSLFNENEESAFTFDHLELLAEIGFTFVDNTKAKKAPQSTAKMPTTKRAEKSITARYISRLNDTLPPLSPVYDMGAV